MAATVEMSPGRSLGFWVPFMLVLALVADLASRFVSYDHVSFRAWEAMTRGGPTGLGGKLLANHRYVNDRAFGDLAAMGNYPALRQYRREVFTTDEFGMRNQPAARSRPWAAILAGTSFSIGSGVSDDQTLSAQLAQILDAPVYNAAGTDIGDERQIRALVRRLGLSRATLVLDITEGAPPPTLADLKPIPAGDPGNGWEARLGSHARQVHVIANAMRGWLAQSPLKLTFYQQFKRIQDDQVLPNRFAHLVIRDELSNGDPILFGAFQIDVHRPPSEAAQVTAFCRGLAQMLRGYQLNLLVVLIPSQYRIYGPLVKKPRDGIGADTFLADMEVGLRVAGISFVNLTNVLAAGARDGLAARRYVFFRDDTHWSAQGIAIAARAVAPQVKAMMTEQGRVDRGAAAPQAAPSDQTR